MMRKKYEKKLYDFLSSVSIELKIYGMVLIVVLLVTIISLFVVRMSITTTLTQQIEDRARSISSDLSARSVDLMLTHNIYAMQSLVTDTLNSYQDIEYIFILNKENEVVVDSSESGFISEELIAANQPENEEAGKITNAKKLKSDMGDIQDSASPILQDVGGTIRVGLTYQSLDTALYKVTSQMILTMVGVMFLSGIIIFGLTRILTIPISNLVELTNKVSKGNLRSRISTYPKDEIGKLTVSFNKMLDTLQASEKEKTIYIEKINNRNKELSLLNDLSKNFMNINQMKEALQYFVLQLVKELDLRSAIIRVEIDGEVEQFFDSSSTCAKECNNFDKQMTSCLNAHKEDVYNFPLVISNGDQIGEVIICSPKKLDEAFIKILTSLSNQITVTVENLELWKEVKKKEEVRLMLLEKLIRAQEDERKRIARELHDETSHSLSSMLVELKLLEEGDSAKKEKAIRNLRSLVRNAIEEVHQMAWQLRPSILDKFGLKVAIERYVEEFKQKTNIDTDLIINGSFKKLSPEQETAIFRLIQESLTNITKYANASYVSIIMISTSQHVSVVVEDDGVGFNLKTAIGKDPSKDHLGLIGMHERIALLNGTLDIESEIGSGTTVLAKIPLVESEGEVIVS